MESGRPKSTNGSAETEREGFDAIAQYGRGDFDEATGTYDWYETPPEVTGRQIRAPWDEVFAAFNILRFDFQRHLHIDLAEAIHTRSWRWFADQVNGLLSMQEFVSTSRGVVPLPGSLIAARFTDAEEPDNG